MTMTLYNHLNNIINSIERRKNHVKKTFTSSEYREMRRSEYNDYRENETELQRAIRHW